MAKENTSFYVILGILSLKPRTGYDVKKKIENQIGFFFRISNGQIYPALSKIVADGLATMQVEETDGKPDRKVYTITPKGEACFRKWLEAPVNYANPNGNEFLLKLYFGSLVPGEHVSKIISDYLEMKERRIRSYAQIQERFNLNTFQHMADYFSYFTLRYGQILDQAAVDWCRETASLLEKLKEQEKVFHQKS